MAEVSNTSKLVEDNKSEDELELEFDTSAKKKSSKTKAKKKVEVEIVEDEKEIEGGVEEALVPHGTFDYTYEELANKIYQLLHNSNPDFATKKKRIMKPPYLTRIGSKKTGWLNFKEICDILGRKPQHFFAYVLIELGTDGSIDGSGSMVIKGRFQPKQIENVIRHYIADYVACKICKSAETLLKKENRIYFVSCQACGSSRSVTTVKKGFEAQVGKRKKDEKK